MYDTWLPNLNQQVLFEQMMLDAIVWMVLAVLTIALMACLFYLVSIVLLFITETKSVAIPKQNIRQTGALASHADSRLGAAGSRSYLRISAAVGIFVVAILASWLLLDLAAMIR
ncbi:MAG: hypothetical protein IPM66_12475 [Acidobacteriota bacterium]|nr:MAG: hypothetical protein IPM66_12475 [Acidobacteriota bacterium]